MFHSECFIKAEGRGLRRALRRLSLCRERTLEVHSPHTAARHGRGWRLLLWRFRDHGLGRHQQAGDRRCVLQRGAHDLGGIDDAAVDQVHVVLGLRVEAEGLGLVLHDLADHDRALDAGVFGDLPRRRFQRLEHDIDAGLYVGIAVGDLADGLLGAQERDAAARHDPFLDRGAGGVERVLDPVLLLLDLDLGGAANADHRHAARELGQPLLQLLAVIVGRGLLDLRLDLADASLDVLLFAGAVDNRGLLLLDDDLLGAPEHGGGHVLELDAELFGDELAAGEDRDVLEHGLAAVAEAGGLDGGDLEPAAKFVDDEGGERLALDVLGHDQQRLAGLDDRLEHREHRLQSGELLLVQQDEGVLELGHHLLGIGDEVGREVAAVELHAFDDLDFGVERFGFLDRDHAFVADLLHRLGDHLADLAVAVRRERAHLGDLRGRADLLRALLDILHHRADRDVDAALEVHRVHAGGHRLGALLDDRLREHGRGGGAVAGYVVGLLGDLAHHLGAHVLELVLELDFLRHRHAVLGDAGRAEALVEHDVAALGAQRHLHGVGQYIDAAQHLVTRVAGESYVFGSHFTSLHLSLICLQLVPRPEEGPQRRVAAAERSCFRPSAPELSPGARDETSTSGDHAHDVGLLHDQEVLAVELDFGAGPFAEQHPVAGLDVGLDDLVGDAATTGPHRDDLALRGFLLDGVGDDDAALRFFLGIDTFHDHTVVQGTELGLGHELSSQGAGRALVFDRYARSVRLLALNIDECQPLAGT